MSTLLPNLPCGPCWHGTCSYPNCASGPDADKREVARRLRAIEEKLDRILGRGDD